MGNVRRMLREMSRVTVDMDIRIYLRVDIRLRPCRWYIHGSYPRKICAYACGNGCEISSPRQDGNVQVCSQTHFRRKVHFNELYYVIALKVFLIGNLMTKSCVLKLNLK